MSALLTCKSSFLYSLIISKKPITFASCPIIIVSNLSIKRTFCCECFLSSFIFLNLVSGSKYLNDASPFPLLGISNYLEMYCISPLLYPHRYNMLFRFLLNVKRVQLELQQCWAVQMQHKHQNFKRWDAAQWRLRSHMAFLIDNLQYFLQV